MSEKPLAVRVAEALGWTELRPARLAPAEYHGFPPTDNPVARTIHGADAWVPHYDTDWSATGPLIEKYGIHLTQDGGQWAASEKMPEQSRYFEKADAPLLAVCSLILALHAAGKV